MAGRYHTWYIAVREEEVLTSKKPNSYGVPGGPTINAFTLRISESSYVIAKAINTVSSLIELLGIEHLHKSFPF